MGVAPNDALRPLQCLTLSRGRGIAPSDCQGRDSSISSCKAIAPSAHLKLRRRVGDRVYFGFRLSPAHNRKTIQRTGAACAKKVLR